MHCAASSSDYGCADLLAGLRAGCCCAGTGCLKKRLCNAGSKGRWRCCPGLPAMELRGLQHCNAIAQQGMRLCCCRAQPPTGRLCRSGIWAGWPGNPARSGVCMPALVQCTVVSSQQPPALPPAHWAIHMRPSCGGHHTAASDHRRCTAAAAAGMPWCAFPRLCASLFATLPSQSSSPAGTSRPPPLPSPCHHGSLRCACSGAVAWPPCTMGQGRHITCRQTFLAACCRTCRAALAG